MKRPFKWVGVERAGELVSVPGTEELEAKDLETAKDFCRSEVEFRHPRLQQARFIYFVDKRELTLVRKACAQLERLLSRMSVHYRGTVDLRPRMFQLLRKVKNGTLTENDLPKTWKQLDLEDLLKKGRTKK